uniref:Vacuolar ATPase assembly protein VMA22 n=1 Tax=Ornithodoros turicata TaxID=34597 RepID=A0A2R5LFD0_9ACAR
MADAVHDAPSCDASEKADDVVITALERMETILSLREGLNELFESGLLDLARARYANGNRSVSALQLHLGEISARRTVATVPQKSPSTGGMYNHFEIVTATQGNGDSEEPVRKRHGDSKDDEVKVEPHRDQDPLKWFGVLVPSSLRTSQRRFVSALEVIADIATEQSRLQDSLEWYKKHKRSVSGVSADK